MRDFAGVFRWARYEWRWAAVSLLMATPTAAVSGPTTTQLAAAAPRPVQAASGHIIFWDYVVVYAGMGAVAAVVDGHAHDQTFRAGPLLGHGLFMALGALFSQGEAEIFDRHGGYSTLHGMQRKAYRGIPVEVRLRDGGTIAGPLLIVSDDSVVVKARGEQQSIPGNSIATIHMGHEPPWDMALLGAGAGALYALVWANNSVGDGVVYVSRGRMAAYGAAILGGTALALDLLHGSGEVLYRGDGLGHALTPEITPVFSPDGALLALTWHF